MKSYMQLNVHCLMRRFENPATVGKIELTKCALCIMPPNKRNFTLGERTALFYHLKHNLDPQKDGQLKRGTLSDAAKKVECDRKIDVRFWRETRSQLPQALEVTSMANTFFESGDE